METNEEALNKALRSLKDFQLATVKRVCCSLFDEGRKAMLVADEVGLGKTIVARGVIATALKAAAARGESTLRVTYVCSNQAIARENEQKLNPFPDKSYRPQTIRRMAELAMAPGNKNPAPNGVIFELNSLTPSTSFESRSSTGTAREREIIAYLLMNGDPVLATLPEGIACVMKGDIGEERLLGWATGFADKWEREGDRLRSGLAADYAATLARTSWSVDIDYPDQLASQIGASLLDLVRFLTRTVTLDNEPHYRDTCKALISQLRSVLIEKCATFLKTDLFVLDEFQRFKDLIEIPEDPDAPQSQAARIANLAFNQREARVLMLSATPFKAFSGNVDDDTEDAHYEEFKIVLRFLLQNDQDKLPIYEGARRRLYHQFGSLSTASLASIDTSAKRVIEDILRPIMCRTERISFSKMAQTVQNRCASHLTVTASDIASYLDSDRLMSTVGANRGKPELSMPVDYSKSSPFTFSFLRGYKLHGEVAASIASQPLRSTQASSSAWLPLARINRYEPVVFGDQPHARLASLAETVFQQNAHLLLWIPPSLPYYRLQGAFAGAEGYTKTLVFSAWRLVPRMIAALTSYEVERLTIGDERTRDATREQSARTYFHDSRESESSHRRHPRPQIVFRAQREVLHEVQSTALLYPCRTYAELVDPQSLVTGVDYDSWHNAIHDRLKTLLEPEIQTYAQEGGRRDAWYWAAGPLLDRHDADQGTWQADSASWRDSNFFESKKDGDEESRKFDYFRELTACMTASPDELNLGQPPDDLYDVLADIVIGSPAVCCLRTLLGEFPEDSYSDIATRAVDLAGAFVTLFNKPESIAAIRLAVPDDIAYWRRVLVYCRQGCIQSMLDEYIDLLDGQFRDLKEVTEVASGSINIMTTQVTVDDADTICRKDGHHMRSHFAVDFGGKNLVQEDGENRVRSLRHSFNSPFRPFVLASTSIGQEGLDFHLYCRRVIHWNLPSNPIDLEQREGRVDRFKGHAIRLGRAATYRSLLESIPERGELWNELFRIAQEYEHSGENQTDLLPFWLPHSQETDCFPIERRVLIYPFSREEDQYRRMLRTLAVYRLTFGQPRQLELAKFLENTFTDEEISQIRRQLSIDLCPMRYES